MLSLLGSNHCLPLFHMDRTVIWLNETKQFIIEFTIGYMINPNLNTNKAFIEKLETFMKNTFGPITQPHIRATLSKIIQVC